MNLKYVVTGCAGFIGSHICDRLLADGNVVAGIDNLSTGNLQFLESAAKSEKFTLIQADLLHPKQYEHVFEGADVVMHLAANADVRFGIQRRRCDLEQNTIATFNVLECMIKHEVSSIAFSSTGSVYGEAEVFPTPERAAFPIQTSLYGASKLACEGLITAYSEGFGLNSYIFRFVSILGPRYTHGHVVDFCAQLTTNPNRLRILGDGCQKKSYLHISDCVEAIFTVINRPDDGNRVHIYNLGTNEYCQVNDSIGWICDRLNVNPRLTYSGGKRGWIGDNPFIFLATDEICSLGWAPSFSIKAGVENTVDYIVTHPWVMNNAVT